MDSDTKKEKNKAKPYELDELVYDGEEDRERLLATWEKKYQEILKRKKEK